MGGFRSRRELSDGSNWSITDYSPSDSPLFKIDLDIHQTYVSVVAEFRNEETGDTCRWTRDLQHSDTTRVPTLELPGTMNRIDYYLAIHSWLHSLRVEFPLDDDLVNDFTDQVLECVFGRLVDDVDQKVALCVSVDLYRVPVMVEKDSDEEEYDPMEDEEEEDDPVMEDDEEDDPIMEYEDEEDDPMAYEDEEYDPDEDDEEYDPIKGYRAKWLTDIYAVVAAEEHCKLGDCLICLSLLVSDEEGNKCLFGAPCGHYFHGKCMLEWLMTSVSCPLCRFDISSIIRQ